MKVLARAARWAGIVGAALALVATGWWAGRVTLGSPVGDREQQPSSVSATVKEATVGRSLSLTVTVQQPFVPVAVNGLIGTVTSVDVSGRVDVGTVLYTVDTIPVRAVKGTLPFYRALGPGADGPDVSQLQRALRTLGHYRGEVSGRYGAETATAVRAWQRELRIAATGTVRLGEVVAVPTLPGHLRLGEQIVRAARVGGGEQAVFAPSGSVDFYLSVSEAQTAMIPPAATVMVTHSNHTWPATIVDSASGSDGTVRFTLAAPGGGRVCVAACLTLPAQERLSLPGRVTVVPEVTGPAVPAAAVHTTAEGAAYVLLVDGTRRDVTVRGSAGGVVVVGGLRIGERVLVLGATPAATGR